MGQADFKAHSKNPKRTEDAAGTVDSVGDTLAWKLAWRRELWRKWLGMPDTLSPVDEVNNADSPIGASTTAKMAIDY